jgi:hypothetical protein
MVIPRDLPGGSEKTMDINHEDRCLRRDLNRAPPPYKPEALPLNPAASIVESAAARVFTSSSQWSRPAQVELEHYLLRPLRVNSLTDSHKFQLLTASNFSLWRIAYTPYVRATCWNCMIYCTEILYRNSIRLYWSNIQRTDNRWTSQRTKINISVKIRRISIPIKIYFSVHLCERVHGLPHGRHNMQSRFMSNIYPRICLVFTICYFSATDVYILFFTSCKWGQEVA